MTEAFVYEAVSPVGPRAAAPIVSTRRDPDLNGKTIAELWDQMFRGELIYPVIRDALRSRYPGVKFVDYTHFGNTHGAGQNALIADLPRLLAEKGCDAVISGIGA